MHTFKTRVYYSDTDCSGIVYHTRYLDFAEHARTELLRELSAKFGVEDSQSSMIALSNIAFVVKSISVDYQKPGQLDDEITVTTEIESEKRFSLTFLQTVLREGEVLAVLRVRVASIHTQTLKPVPLPAWFAESMQTV